MGRTIYCPIGFHLYELASDMRHSVHCQHGDAVDRHFYLGFRDVDDRGRRAEVATPGDCPQGVDRLADQGGDGQFAGRVGICCAVEPFGFALRGIRKCCFVKIDVNGSLMQDRVPAVLSVEGELRFVIVDRDRGYPVLDGVVEKRVRDDPGACVI